MRSSYAIDKICGFEFTPTHFLKSRGSIIRNNFLNAELIMPHTLCDEMIFMHCSQKIKQNKYTIGFFRAPVVTQFYILL